MDESSQWRCVKSVTKGNSMLNWVQTLLSNWRGKNTASTPKDVILRQMSEPRPLPMGRKEFEVWSDRIIGGAMIPGATPKSLKFALAEMVMHAKPTDSHIPDGYFIQCLRKSAANQVCWEIVKESQEEKKAAVMAAQTQMKVVTNVGEAKVT
jgi:hypothetical protein